VNLEPSYFSYFGFKENPFSVTPDETYFFESRSHKRVLDYLRFFLRQRESMALVCGDVGTGKTITSRVLISSLDREKYNSALILNPFFNERELLKEIMRELFFTGIEDGSLRDMYERLQGFLIEEFKKGKVTLCVIDEAQLLPDRTLDFVRVLSNFETNKEKLIHIIFFAQKEFKKKLQREDMKYLAQRITMTVELESLEKDEIVPYINYRIFKAGLRGTLRCEKSAGDAIYSYTRGNPRLINLLCDRALLFLYVNSMDVIDGKVIRSVAEEESIKHLIRTEKPKKPVVRRPFVLLLLFTALLFLFFKFQRIGSILSLFWS
jgi:general secretion pathway protein A